MCGQHNRCFMGHQPKAILLTALMINLPMTFFNIAIAPAPLWDENTRAILIFLGIILQIASTVLMLWTSIIDPGIVPATHISRHARYHIDKKYLKIKHKSQRVAFLINQGKAQYGADFTG